MFHFHSIVERQVSVAEDSSGSAKVGNLLQIMAGTGDGRAQWLNDEDGNTTAQGGPKAQGK